jgi:hypothetical protein
MPLTSNL